MRKGDGMNTSTQKKPTAAEIAATIDTILEMERRRAPLDHRDWSDKTADRFCELTAEIYDMDEDTQVENHRGFALVWNSCGVWRVEVKRGKVTGLA